MATLFRFGRRDWSSADSSVSNSLGYSDYGVGSSNYSYADFGIGSAPPGYYSSGNKKRRRKKKVSMRKVRRAFKRALSLPRDTVQRVRTRISSLFPEKDIYESDYRLEEQELRW